MCGEENPWTPIGSSYGSRYTGTFDGNGHTVSGLYVGRGETYAGLFGSLNTGGVVGQNSGTVENCAFTGTINGGSGFNSTGGVVGGNDAGGAVKNCRNTGAINGGASCDTGGVAGSNDYGAIENCCNIGKVTGSGDENRTGGVVGYNKGGTIENCYNTGAVTSDGRGSVGGVAGNNSNGTIKNCYYLTGDELTGIGGAADTDGTAEGKEKDDFKSGAVAYLLNGDDAGKETSVWRQNIDKGTRDEYPVPDAGHGVVYLTVGGGYSNTEAGTAEAPYEIDTAEDLLWFAGLVNGTLEGVEPDNAACAKLMNDIIIYENLLDENGDPEDGSNLVSWEPIGRSGGYSGTFDGNGCTISGLYCTVSGVTSTVAGLFGTVGIAGSGGTVRNLTVADSFVFADSSSGKVGGICGENLGTITGCTFRGRVSVSVSDSSISNVGGVCGQNAGTVESCWNDGSVTANGTFNSLKAGGVCGQNNGIVRNCLNTGEVTAEVTGDGDIGGVCGCNEEDLGSEIENSGTVTNCLNTGEVTGEVTGEDTDANIGGVCGINYATVTNCYYRTGTGEGYPTKGIGSSAGTASSSQAEGKSEDVLKSGAVAFLLNNKSTGEKTTPWRQNLDNGAAKDDDPVLDALDPGHGIVYPIKKVGSEEEIARYSNDPQGRTGIGANDVTLSTEPLTYNGREQRPAVTVTVGGKTLVEGTDYTVTTEPENSVNAGNYTIIISGKGDYVGTVTAAYTIRAAETGGETGGDTGSGGSHRPAKPDGPSTGTSDGWKDIREEIRDAEKGDTITIDMGDETEVPGEVFEEIAGRDVTVEFELEDGVSWTVSGADIPADADFSDLDLGVSMDTRGIPVNVFNAVTGEYGSVQFTLAHNGPFGFTLTLTAPLGRDNAGYWANLYYYHERGRELEFVTSARIGKDGSAALRLTHASQYAVVIDDRSHAPQPEPEPLLFTDVPEGAWYEDAVRYVWENGLMTGTGAEAFSPEGVTTRGQIVTILWRLAGSPVVNYLMDFDDADPAAWYGEAVRWAVSEGIAAGYGDGRFGPDDPITREQLAVMLYRYARHEGYGTVQGGMAIREYADYDQISDFALEALDWAVSAGIINGTSGTTLSPQGTAARAQAAAMLQRFCELDR